MGHLPLVTRALALALVFSQVVGNPMMFFSQTDPDCDHQQSADNSPPDPNNQNYQAAYQGYQGAAYQAQNYQGSGYAAPSYQGGSYQTANYQAPPYQGPSYQDTLQTMISETLRALCSVVQSTVEASKQEIAALARIFMQKASGTNCNSEGEGDQASTQNLGGVSNSIVESQKEQSTGPALDVRFGEEKNTSTISSQAVESAGTTNNSTVETLSADKSTTALPSNSTDEEATLSLKSKMPTKMEPQKNPLTNRR